MKIKVSYSELKTGSGYNNQRAEAEIELDETDIQINGGADLAFRKIWKEVRRQVRLRLGCDSDEIPF